MKKFLKYFFGGLLILIVVGAILIRLFVHESKPKPIDGNAEAVASTILEAINKEAWDTLPYASWTFTGVHHYVWDKVNDHAIVKWDDNEVHIDTKSVTGKVFKNGEEVQGDDKTFQKAWSYWCNDMWWFAAPFKIKDPGTSRQLAVDKDGNQGLLVSYDSGGVTPGDSYLWFYDDSGLPTGYKMWVKIIPVGGVYTSWQDWTTLDGGAKVATQHQGNISALKIPITNIKSGNTWTDLGYDANPIKL